MSQELGNDELTDDARRGVSKAGERMRAELFKCVADGDKIRTYLSTPEGRAIRNVIADRQYSALQGCASNDIAERDQARFEYRVFKGVEEVFAELIASSVEAIRVLQVTGE